MVEGVKVGVLPQQLRLIDNFDSAHNFVLNHQRLANLLEQLVALNIHRALVL